MSEKLKRGAPFPDGLEQQEARLLGPYPTWSQWRSVVERKFGISFEEADSTAGLLHEFYCMRRLQQKAHRIDKEEVSAFWERAEATHPGFEEEYKGITRFIINKTPVVD